MCEWASDAARQDGAIREVALVALAQCGASAEKWFDSDDAPPELVIEFWSSRSYDDGFTSHHIPALARALTEVARDGDLWIVRRGAFAMADADDPQSTAALLDLHHSLPAGDARDAVAASFADLTDPEAKKIFDAFCARPGRKDPICGMDRPLVRDAEESVAVDDCIGKEGLRAELQSGPGGSSHDVRECLENLATRDRSAAVAQAETIDGWSLADPWLAETAAALVRYPEEGMLLEEFRRTGLLHRGPLHYKEGWTVATGLTPRDVLFASGPVHCFDVETGMYPNDHDALLYELAELAGDPFTSIIFDEIPPPADMEDGTFLVDSEQVNELPRGTSEGDPYELYAWLDGRTWTVQAQDFGDWYDLDQVLGLLNAIALDLGSEMRFTTLGTGDQTACVLAAPREAILAAAKEGLIEIATAGDAMESGKAFEEEAIGKYLEQNQ